MRPEQIVYGLDLSDHRLEPVVDSRGADTDPQLLISLHHPIERQMVDIFADDDVCQQRGVCHTLVKRCGRQGCYPEGFPIRIRHLKITLENELVADNPADKHLPGDQYQAVGNFGSHLRIVLPVVHVRIEMLLLHFQATGVDGLADLAVVGFNMNEFILLCQSLFRLLVQAGLLGRIHFLLKEAAGELLGLFGKAAPFRLLAEEHLRVLGKGTPCDKQLFFESRVLGLKLLHLFLFFGSHFLPVFLYVKVRKNGHIRKSEAVFL